MKRKTRKTIPSMAINTTNFRQEDRTMADGTTFWKGYAQVLWARQNNGAPKVLLGEVIGVQEEKAPSATVWLERYTQPMERHLKRTYNGRKLTGYPTPEEQQILEQFHATGELPPGFDGWWTPDSTMPANGLGHHSRPDEPLMALCGEGPLMVGLPGPVDKNGNPRICPVCVAKNAEIAV